MQRVVFSGGPGAGKTAVLLALRSRGYPVVEETARAVIQERRSRGLTPRTNPLEFATEVLQRDIAKYREQPPQSDYVFFDRGILDALCMLDRVRLLPQEELTALLSTYPYHRQVFFFPPWELIYANDAEHDQTFTEAKRVHERLVEWYRRCGYEMRTVPMVSVAERSEYVLQALGKAA